MFLSTTKFVLLWINHSKSSVCISHWWLF